MAFGVFVLFAGMLFWTKLRLVSDIPRSAYAVPKEQQDANPDDGAASQADSGTAEADGAEKDSGAAPADERDQHNDN